MSTHEMAHVIRTLAGATLLAALLAGCGQPTAPEVLPAPPAGDPGNGTAPANPAEAPAAPAQPAPDAPPPQEPSPAPTPAANNDPDLSTMRAATASAKISVPVDLRYRFDGPVIPNQPVMLHLAAVPRTGGSNLKVSVASIDGLRLDASTPTAIQKVTAAGIYRQQIAVTAAAGAPTAIRVLVTMDMAEGSGFGFFTVPLEGGTAAQKQKSVKLR
ncbi:MAG: hypothetical protein WDO72_01525 [Pseudomonadota bacterium]